MKVILLKDVKSLGKKGRLSRLARATEEISSFLPRLAF